MSVNEMLMAAAGTGGPVEYVDDVFSTWLYNGTGSAQTITNGIDLAGKGGLVWSKGRDQVGPGTLVDTVRGRANCIFSNLTFGNQVSGATQDLTSFNSNGFSLGTDFQGGMNTSGSSQVAWTFREAPKFFDVVTYTGNGANRTIAHSLDSVPGMIIVKRTDASANWQVYHRSTGAANALILNLTNASGGSTAWNSTTPTSTVFSLSSNANVNASGGTYVAYLFAHNAGGFGAAGTDNVISCGSFTTNGSAAATVELGYEPQYVLIKGVNGGAWFIHDVMRGFAQTQVNYLMANASDAETAVGGQYVFPTATGFSSLGSWFDPSTTYIYMAIRRPMKPPTSGTQVFSPVAYTGDGSTGTIRSFSTGFPVDMQILHNRTNQQTGASGATALSKNIISRLTGLVTTDTIPTFTRGMVPSLSETEGDIAGYVAFRQTTFGIHGSSGQLNNDTETYITHNFRRATGFFDVVCYTGTGANRTVTHNLGVAPELMIVKSRSPTGWGWHIYNAFNGATQYMRFSTDPSSSLSTVWNNTAPTSSVFTVGTSVGSNQSGTTYVAYLFASLLGISKIGSYTGNGSSQTINCGFAAGARFVMIKRTDSDGDWYVWDTARGIIAGNDPHLSLNTTAAEVTTNDSVDPVSSGFAVNQLAATNINVNAATYIYLAIA